MDSDRYGRLVPKQAHGTENLGEYTSSCRKIVAATTELFDKITDKSLLVRRINITVGKVLPEDNVPETVTQLELFSDNPADTEEDECRREKERRMQETLLSIKHRFGKNAILKGTNFDEGATGRERNNQIGGHKA